MPSTPAKPSRPSKSSKPAKASKPLEEYRRKRDFAATPEPAGSPAPAAGAHPGALAFVIHKHAARSLHYDLRLEVGGVYASWAVPKGPSLDTKDKHLAVHVEDHPLEYGAFEGVIPAGEYGGGTVMIWDRGTFEPVGDVAAGIAKGDFKFVLSGTKLHGQWVLVRMKPRPGEKHEAWLLIKERDEHVRPHDAYDVVAEMPDSAATGRTMEEIAAGGDVWHSKAPVDQPGDRPADPPSAPSPADPPPSPATPSAPGRDPFPADTPFQLATLVNEAPAGDEWVHEVKYDGYRLHVALRDGKATTRTRNGADWSDRFPSLVRAAEALPVTSALLDGEAVVLDKEGRSDFGLLQEALSSKDHSSIRFEVFDLLFLDGHDLRAETLVRRKSLLAELLQGAAKDGPLQYVEHFAGRGPDYHAASCRLLLEGSMSKRGDRPYVPGRTRDWVKVKCLARQEFVVGGWTDPAGSREGFGALLLGVHDAEGLLQYAGRVGTGFTERTLAELSARLSSLATPEPPFAEAPRAVRVHWARPELVVEIVFREWTRDGLVRQGAYKGMREDKDPADVVREDPAQPRKALPASAAPRSAPDPAASTAARARRGPARPSAAPADPPVPDPPAPSGPAVVRGVAITHPEKVLPPAGLTKLELARYYDTVAEHMLPHVLNRPLTIVRCPAGATGEAGCFYQKHPEARGWPAVFGSVQIEDSGGPATYVFVRDAEGLIALAQMGTLEVHTWGSLASDPEHPDRIVFDLDPGPGVEFSGVADGARSVRDALQALGLTSFVKTTGGHGLHVVTPIVPDRTWDEVRAFAHGLVDIMSRERPADFTSYAAKDKRGGRVFIDYLRNAHGATAVAAYSTRARPGGRVSVPLTWDALASGIDPADYDTRSVPRRLAHLKGDPWAGYDDARRTLDNAALAAVGVLPLLP